MQLYEKYSNFLFFGIITTSIYVLIYNILHYSPLLGYDAEAHHLYVDYISRYLPRSFRLPTDLDTREFFNPPLAYIFPAISQILCRNIIDSTNYLQDCRPIYGTATQIFQSFIYLLTIWINLITFRNFTKSRSLINTSYVLLISMLAVNYRTISMIRGEPYILFFLSIFLYLISKTQDKNYEINLKNKVFLGIIIGFIALSRQWGFLLFLPIIFLLFSKVVNNKSLYFKNWALSAIVGFFISGWFYINLYLKYGTFTAFNMSSKSFAFSNQPFSFYIPSLENISFLFSKPIRPHLDNQFISILYSDLWGDYWGYFSFTSRYLDVGRNQLEIGDFFGNVNKISIITFSLIIFFCFMTNKTHKNSYFVKYLNLAIIVSLIGYFIFSILYPVPSGDQIKSTYIIQVFHLLVFLSSIYFEKLKETNIRVYALLLSILIGIYIYNFQTYLSHFPINFLG